MKTPTLFISHCVFMKLDLFQLTLKTIQTDEELVAQQAIEFWSTICDEEILILDEAEEAKQYKQQAPRQCLYFIKGAANYLIPVLTEVMTKGVRHSITTNHCQEKFMCLFFLNVLLLISTELMTTHQPTNTSRIRVLMHNNGTLPWLQDHV
jgi:hypothetical protein